MKIINYIISFLVITVLSFSCKKLDIPPMNIINDNNVFSDEGGITAYMARIYSELPIEDFRYSPARGFNNFWIISPFSAVNGEALSRDQTGSMQESNSYWSSGYGLIRECNYFIQNIPKYSSKFSTQKINYWLGEVRFVRALTYFAMVKRYGGVPIVDSVLVYPTSDLSSLNIPRSSESAVYDTISSDLDFAYNNLPATSDIGRANKYAAAGFKSRAMLFAGSIAKYNNINLVDSKGNRLCGIPMAKSNNYFKQSYDAAKLLSGIYSLYTKNWSAGDKNAQFQNYVNLFFDATSNENIFVKQYQYPNSVHGYDAYNVPRQLMGANGYSAEINPTLDLVELYDGIPKNADGTIQTQINGKYILYDNTMDLFANAEPRLRATVILPGDIFKDQSIEIRRGLYTGNSAGGISPLISAGSTSSYPSANLITSSNSVQTAYKLPNGTLMNPAGLSGVFTSDGTCAISGFSVRKWLVPDKPTAEVLENRSDQSWIELRYAEVLLNQAEAAYELYNAGQGASYLSDAFNDINLIRLRAGADLLSNTASLNNVDIIRKERRKELAFENKLWWDQRRWHTIDKEQNNTLYRILMPFYVVDANKYFFDARTDERNVRYTFDPRWYYETIPSGSINKNSLLIQNPGY